MRTHRSSRALMLPLVVVLLLAVAGCAGAHTSVQRSSSPTATSSSAASPSPSSSPATSPTAYVPTDISKLGWVQDATLTYPEALAATPGALYSCTGATNAGKANPTITFSVSTNRGASWQTSNTPIFAGFCQDLAISPTAGQDAAIYSGTCRGDCGMSTQTLYVTSDGGQHWALVATSQENDAGSVFGWVGTTLFVNAAPAGTPHAPQQYLARGTNGGAFTWTTLPAAPGTVLASGNTLYAVTGSQSTCDAAGFCSDLWSSTDLGTTWMHLTPTYQGNNLHVEALASGSGALFAYDARALAGPNVYPLYRSGDGGRSWQPLPQLASDMQADTDATVTPDGTAYVFYQGENGNGSQPMGIYKLAPGAGAWQLVSPVAPAQVHVVAVQSDASGRPVTLWGFEQIGDERYSLWSHSA